MEQPRRNSKSTPIISRASAADASLVIAVIEDAARWLMSRGIAQWQWFLTPAGHDLVNRRIAMHEVYLVHAGATGPNDAIATVTVQWSDRDFWLDRGDDGTAGYVHGLAVRRAHAGLGWGEQLIDHAADRCRQRGRSLLRLDCMADNSQLRAYYERLGFELVEQRRVHDRFDSALYQRAVAAI
jgi:ribosomal protein S18 acetylase RimI-like enzyme